MSPKFIVNLNNVKSAFVSTVLMAVLAIAVYIISVGDIYALDKHKLANIGVMAMLTGIVSLIKAFLTDSNNVFLGSGDKTNAIIPTTTDTGVPVQG